MSGRPWFLAADREWPPRRAAEAKPAEGLVQVVGELVRQPEMRFGTGGSAVVLYEIGPGMGVHLHATVHVPGDAMALQAASAKARSLRTGQRVFVTARGCRPRNDHSAFAITLLDVTHVGPLQEN